MQEIKTKIIEVKEGENSVQQFAIDVLAGLSAKHKHLSSKYFYDDKGSEIFKKITDLEEYYLTKAEYNVLDQNKHKIADRLRSVGPFNFVEFGSGDGRKTKILLKYFINSHLNFHYYPIDISKSSLEELVEKINIELPLVEVTGLVCDYFKGIAKLSKLNEKPNFVLFLGSNIGNFEAEEREKFMLSLWHSLSPGDMALIGFDLIKDEEKLLKAYKDSEGVTSAFNLNLLERINRELLGDIDVQKFSHYACYDPVNFVMKSYLLSQEEQTVELKRLNKTFRFEKMEPIFMENSHKFSFRMIKEIAEASNFELLESFTDDQGLFADVILRRR